MDIFTRKLVFVRVVLTVTTFEPATAANPLVVHRRPMPKPSAICTSYGPIPDLIRYLVPTWAAIFVSS